MENKNEKLMGGQPGKVGPTEYVLVKKLADHIVVRDTESNKLELWGKHSDTPAGFSLMSDEDKYEFITSDKNRISSSLKTIIKEMSATGAVAGFSTPYAFTKNKKGNIAAAKAVSGYTLVEDEAQELIGEGKYNNFKKYPMKNEAKISLSLREVNKILREVENLVHMNSKLKTEGNIKGAYWKRSAQDVASIKERTKNIVRGIREIVRGRLNEIAAPAENPMQNEPVVPNKKESVVPTQKKEEPTTPDPSEKKIYTISIDFLNFENDVAGTISKHEEIIRKKLFNKEATFRASKGYGQIEKDYTIVVKNISLVLYKEKYNLILKDANKKEYYVNTTFKMHIKPSQSTQPVAEPANPNI